MNQEDGKSYDIYHFMPFSLDRDYAKEINKYVKLVPNDNDWIVIWDGDTCRTISNWGETIAKAIELNLDFDILSGTATRTGGGGGNLQKMYRDISYERDMLKLHSMCVFHQKKYADLKAIEQKTIIVGFMLMFRKKLAVEIPFRSDLTRGGILDWDSNWFSDTQKAGKKAGVIRGISIYHHYRLHKKKADTKHLFYQNAPDSH